MKGCILTCKHSLDSLRGSLIRHNTHSVQLAVVQYLASLPVSQKWNLWSKLMECIIMCTRDACTQRHTVTNCIAQYAMLVNIMCLQCTREIQDRHTTHAAVAGLQCYHLCVVLIKLNPLTLSQSRANQRAINPVLPPSVCPTLCLSVSLLTWITSPCTVWVYSACSNSALWT